MKDSNHVQGCDSIRGSHDRCHRRFHENAGTDPAGTPACGALAGRACCGGQRAAQRGVELGIRQRCAAFDAEPAKYSAKANLQLVQTKQFRQTKCPVSGSKVNKEQTIKVSGVKVGFCCDKCKGTLEAASKEDQLTKIFGDAVFTKAFAVKKADEEKKPKKDAESKSSK